MRDTMKLDDISQQKALPHFYPTGQQATKEPTHLVEMLSVAEDQSTTPAQHPPAAHCNFTAAAGWQQPSIP